MSAEEDLDRWFDDRLHTLSNDLMWRCEALDLDGQQYIKILTRGFSWPLAQLIAIQPEKDEHEALVLIVRMIRNARKVVRQKKAEAKARR